MARISYQSGAALCVTPVPPWKRALDILLAGSALICLAPLLVLIMAVVALGSPGPMFFHQRRVGLGGKEFLMWKFRTMHVDVDTSAHQRAVSREIATHGPLTKVDTPAQLIPLGAWLRKSCLDELPQLLNVLRGEMSLVGPRPDPAYAAADYRPWHRVRLDVLPGITGLWQVTGKNRTTFRRMLELDRTYIRRCSLALDLSILLRTPGAILAELRSLPEPSQATPERSIVPPPAAPSAPAETAIER